MAQLNMKAALTNSYTLSKYSVIRQEEVVGDDGIALMTLTVIPNLVAVIYPEGGTVLDRQPAMGLSPKAISVVGRFMLRGLSQVTAGTKYQPDIVVWHGNHYICKSVTDYSDFAEGFTLTMCTLTDNIATPPPEGSV